MLPAAQVQPAPRIPGLPQHGAAEPLLNIVTRLPGVDSRGFATAQDTSKNPCHDGPHVAVRWGCRGMRTNCLEHPYDGLLVRLPGPAPGDLEEPVLAEFLVVGIQHLTAAVSTERHEFRPGLDRPIPLQTNQPRTDRPADRGSGAAPTRPPERVPVLQRSNRLWSVPESCCDLKLRTGG